jgi:chemotaxis protein histidine kinase CheA
MRQRMEDMQATLTKMHTLLKQMRAKAASSSSKDSLTKANLEMWDLMLSQLDKQFDQLRITTLTREDLESRRAAMYKQADAKAAAAAAKEAAAQSTAAAQAPAAGASASGAVAGKAGQAASGTSPQSPAQPSAPDSGLPK